MTLLSTLTGVITNKIVLPPLEGNSGLYLTSDGTFLQWSQFSADAAYRPGTVIYSLSPPAGFLPMTGQLVDTAEYPNLEGILPYKPGFSGGIGNFAFMSGGGTNYGFGLGAPFASTDLDGFLPGITNGIFYPDGSGALLPTNDDTYKPEYGFYDSWHSEFQNPPWIWGYEFPSAVVINKFAIKSAPAHTYMDLEDFTFEGSNDGVTYTVLGTYVNYGANGLQEAGTQQTIANTTAYKYYRFNISRCEYSGTGTGYANIGKVAMEGIPFAADNTKLVVISAAPRVYNNYTAYPYIKT